MFGRRPHQVDNVRLSFKTPKQWLDDFTIAERYDLLFAREPSPHEGEDVAGVGLRVVDRALREAIEAADALAPMGELKGALVVFALRDRITGAEGAVRKVVVGLQRSEGSEWKLVRDWELLKLLNPAADKPRSNVFDVKPKGGVDAAKLLHEAEVALEARLNELDLPFRLPAIERLAMLVPGKPDKT